MRLKKMTIQVINETQQEFDFSLEEIGEQVVCAALDFEEFPFDAMVDITIVDSDEIHRINMEQRQIDRATDVLSFPMIEYEEAGKFDKIEEDEDNFEPDTGEAMLGDIIICADKVREQAKEYGHSLLREYAFLVCHSMLHLMGYDHMTPEEEKVMFEKQEQILQMLGITRE